MSNMGNSTDMTYAKPTGPTGYGAWTFPVIPPGVPTVIIPVAFPLTAAPTAPAVLAQEQVQLVLVFIVALVIWMLPTLCINKRLCCVCFRRWISKRIGTYFALGFFVNLTIIGIVIQHAPHIEANSVFFVAIELIEIVSGKMEGILIQVVALGALVALWLFRKKIAMILGFDQQVVNASLRDLLTGFSMKRMRGLEISIWKAEGLPVGFSSKTLFTRITLGFNEAQHTRPHDKIRDTYTIKERIHLNYDPEDDTQKLTISLKMQEVIGASINQLLPAAGGIMGAVGGLTTPLGPGPGAAIGVITGTGAANSVGADVARVDLSSAMMNRMRDRFHKDGNPSPNSERPSSRTTNTGPAVRYAEENFQRVDLLPQGFLWLRLADISE